MNLSGPQWICKPFSGLLVSELYEILKLRNTVFVVEQQCVYQDTDDKDQKALHLCGYVDGRLAVYARLLPPGASYTEASIGRVVADPDFRRLKLGKALMQAAIEKTLSAFNVSSIRISAQCYLREFYNSLGFEQVSEPYLEDDIPHIEMVYSLNT